MSGTTAEAVSPKPSRRTDSPFVRYLVIGVLNTLVGFGVTMLLYQGFGAGPLTANAGGYAVGIVVSYALNRRYAFHSKRSHGRGVPLFVAAAAVCYACNAMVLKAGLGIGVPMMVAQVAAQVTYTVSFYLLNRYAVFGDGATESLK